MKVTSHFCNDKVLYRRQYCAGERSVQQSAGATRACRDADNVRLLHPRRTAAPCGSGWLNPPPPAARGPPPAPRQPRDIVKACLLYKLMHFQWDNEHTKPSQSTRRPPLMDTHNVRGVTSALPVSWIGIGYLMREEWVDRGESGVKVGGEGGRVGHQDFVHWTQGDIFWCYFTSVFCKCGIAPGEPASAAAKFATAWLYLIERFSFF
ncbi:hypothetical protein EVAR_59837_1 [Eumeta japonica]|uniref:Uncharacterized protein n=1 Tax=Eumeta variegata TaxID=151549 RepID=A0A4C1Z059_EUMVA|nr:hypothetical protein EVAR_59837_1 [Eumeta japonica]